MSYRGECARNSQLASLLYSQYKGIGGLGQQQMASPQHYEAMRNMAAPSKPQPNKTLLLLEDV